MNKSVNTKPRLLFNDENIRILKRKISNEKDVKEKWESYRKKAEKLLTEDFVSEDYADSSDSQHGNYGKPSHQMSEMGIKLGLTYQMTGEKKYAQKLQEAMLFYSNYNKWYGKGLKSHNPPWHSELNTARFCFGFAVGIDCIRQFLSKENLDEIVVGVIDLGILPTLQDWILPETRIHALDSMGHNWWSVCVSEAGLAALAILDEESRAEEWVEAIVSVVPDWFNYEGNVLQNKSPNFDEKGAFYEGVNYANYGLYEYLLFHFGYQNVYGEEIEIPFLNKVGDFFIDACYPRPTSLLSVNFGDSGIEGGGLRAVKLLILNGYDKPEYRWYIKKADQNRNKFFDLLYEGILYQKESKKPAYEKKAKMYSDIGWSMVRSSWDDNETLLAVKSGFTWNHAHADAGSFILMHDGKPLIIDSGSCSYSRPEYGGYYCQSRAHNVVLFENKGQPSEQIRRGCKFPGEMYNLINDKKFRFVMADATGPMAAYFSRYYRSFLWLEDVIFIIDDIRAYESGKMQWLLHYAGDSYINDNKIFIKNESAGVFVEPIINDHSAKEEDRKKNFPYESLIIKEKEGHLDHEPDKLTPYYSLETPLESRNFKNITAVVPEQGKRKNYPIVESMSSYEMIGAKVNGKKLNAEIYLNLRADGRKMHRNSCNEINGWETDAYLLAIIYSHKKGSKGHNSEVKKIFIGGGSYLRRAGKVYFSSPTKEFSMF